MQVKRELTADLPLNKLLVYPMVLILHIVLCGVFFFMPFGPGYPVKEYFYFLVFPLGAFLAGMTAKRFVAYYLKGKWAGLIANSCVVMGNGTAVLLFMFLVSSSIRAKGASFGVLMVAASIIVYRISKLYSNRIYEESIIRVVSYMVAGVSIEFMFRSLWPEGYWDIGLRLSVGDLMLLTFIVLAVFQLASLLDLMEKEKVSRVSLWLKSNHRNKFFAILFIIYLLVDLRRDIMGDAVLGEWIFIFVVLLVVFIVLAVKISGAVNRSPEEKLNKHLQKISFDKIKDISNISKCINDFVDSGSKNGITSCLYYMAYKAGISIGVATTIIAPVLEYKDLEMPSLTTRGNYRVIEERNRQNRIKVIEYVVDNLESYGRGRYNGYGTASGTM